MRVTIATITARAEPRYDWLVDGMRAYSEATKDAYRDEIDLLIVDYLDRGTFDLVPPTRDWPASLVGVTVVRPKSNPYQGHDRVTSRDLHAIANARNTALVYARTPYVAFLDDRVRLGSTYLDTLRDACRREAVICGPCDKKVAGSGVPRIIDDRTRRRPNGLVGVPGDWLYGGNFAAPLERLLDAGGHEEATDPFGRQDRLLGFMLQRRGARIEYSIGMACLFERDALRPGSDENDHPLPRLRPPGKGQAILDRFGNAVHTSSATPNLRVLRRCVERGEALPRHKFTADDLDWYTGERIGDL